MQWIPLNSNGLTYMFIKSSVTAKVNHHKWEEFGTTLGLNPPHFQEIKENIISKGKLCRILCCNGVAN